MTKEDLAIKLNGREYTKEITPSEEMAAKEAGLLIVFGASDDLCELRGAISDEVGVCDGEPFFISNGELLNDLDRDDITVLKKHKLYDHLLQLRAKALRIEPLWCNESNISWTYKTEVPHAFFDVMEDDEVYCRGIVIDLREMG